MNNIRRSCHLPRKELKILPQSPTLPYSFEEDINLKGLFDIISPENNLVLADDMMLSDARGVILRVSETYEKNFGFAHNSIVGRSAFDLEADGTFSPCITADVIRQKRKITATQTINHLHKNVMTVGIPLFDAAGELKYVMCFNTVSMEQINSIQRNYRRLQDSLQQYSQEIAELRTRSTATSLVFKSAPMQRLWTLMQNTANTRANILITGETGVGKSAVAKAIHAMSNRAAGPFIEVNCAVLHENLIESELFGYEKGAFTGAASSGKIGKIELANHGTLFLDEIGELSLRAQADKIAYHMNMKRTLETQPNLDILQSEASEILTEGGAVCGVKTALGDTYFSPVAVVATGVYLNANVVIGDWVRKTGPSGFSAATMLTDNLIGLGLEVRRFKTGTPARVDGKTLDYSKMSVQEGEEGIYPFSFMTDGYIDNIKPCYLT